MVRSACPNHPSHGYSTSRRTHVGVRGKAGRPRLPDAYCPRRCRRGSKPRTNFRSPSSDGSTKPSAGNSSLAWKGRHRIQLRTPTPPIARHKMRSTSQPGTGTTSLDVGHASQHGAINRRRNRRQGPAHGGALTAESSEERRTPLHVICKRWSFVFGVNHTSCTPILR